MFLDGINNKVREVTSLIQWKNTGAVIKWFQGITNKHQTTFLKFDIVSFYPSITFEILNKALDFAKKYTDINEEMVSAILNARKSFLFYKGNPWIKKANETHFDVTEGSFDGAEVCELVGLYMLSQLSNVMPDGAVGCYRDDGLAIIRKHSGPQLDRLRKDIIKCFKDEGLQITIEVNLKVVDFLEVYFDLVNDKFYPYKKPNDNPLYVHINSNHPLMCSSKSHR